jgi:branched-chain amino acid transport system substrate-binding protein
LKAANEFGIANTMKPAALLAFISDINGLDLGIAQGLYLTTNWCRDLDDETCAFGERFLENTGVEPTSNQAAYYSATLTYLRGGQSCGHDQRGQGDGATAQDQDRPHVRA